MLGHQQIISDILSRDSGGMKITTRILMTIMTTKMRVAEWKEGQDGRNRMMTIMMFAVITIGQMNTGSPDGIRVHSDEAGKVSVAE